MIKIEQLKALAVANATIFWAQPYGDSSIIRAINLYKIGIIEKPNGLYFKDVNDKLYLFELEDLYENEDDAEFAKEFRNMKRIQTWSLPTWEGFYNDLKNEDEGCFVLAECGDISLEYKRDCIMDQILLFAKHSRFNWNATKENYLEACKICKKLFLGEINE